MRWKGIDRLECSSECVRGFSCETKFENFGFYKCDACIDINYQKCANGVEGTMECETGCGLFSY